MLEQDLADLAAPEPRDDAFKLELRTKLAVPPKRRRRRRLILAPVAIAAAALAAFLVLQGGSEPVLAQAREALTPPPNRIAHMKLVTADGLFSESWQLTSPPHSARWIGTFGGGPQISDDGKNEYMLGADRIFSRPSAGPLEFSSPLAKLREDLASGKARLAGETTIGGEELHVVKLPSGITAYLGDGFLPRYVDEPTGRGTYRLRVATLEYLPVNAKTRPLLSLRAQHPELRVEVKPQMWSGK